MGVNTCGGVCCVVELAMEFLLDFGVSARFRNICYVSS